MLGTLGAKAQADVIQKGELTSWQPGEVLWRRGEPGKCFHFVVEGRVRLDVWSEPGCPLALGFVEEGGLTCAAAVCLQAPMCCEASATQSTSILTVPATVLLGGSPSGPETLRVMLRAVSNRTVEMCRRLRETTGGARLRHRVATVLLRRADIDGLSAHAGWVRLPRVSRSELAALCGVRPESVTRTLNELAREKLIKKLGTGLLIDVDGLARPQ